MKKMLPLATLFFFVSIVSATVQPLAQRQLALESTAAAARFHPMATCQETTQPEAKDSPLPILGADSVAKVDFIVGLDGRIYSPFFLESNGTADSNAAILRTIGSWRFRPATCNGVPAPAEGRVTFIRQ